MIDLLPLISAHATVREYPAARLAADVLERTELADGKALWIELRQPVANRLRAVARQARIDARGPVAEPDVLEAFAADLESAARELERERDRSDWTKMRERRRDWVARGWWDDPRMRETMLAAMRDTWKEWRR
jgi:hypothetical protein